MHPLTLCLLAILMPLALLSAQPAAAQTITSTSESNPYPGVRLVEGRTSGPATDFHAAYISLCNDYVHVDASAYNGIGGADAAMASSTATGSCACASTARSVGGVGWVWVLLMAAAWRRR